MGTTRGVGAAARERPGRRRRTEVDGESPRSAQRTEGMPPGRAEAWVGGGPARSATPRTAAWRGPPVSGTASDSGHPMLSATRATSPRTGPPYEDDERRGDVDERATSGVEGNGLFFLDANTGGSCRTRAVLVHGNAAPLAQQRRDGAGVQPRPLPTANAGGPLATPPVVGSRAGHDAAGGPPRRRSPSRHGAQPRRGRGPAHPRARPSAGRPRGGLRRVGRRVAVPRRPLAGLHPARSTHRDPAGVSSSCARRRRLTPRAGSCGR